MRQLAAALRQRAEQVWGGAEAAAEQLADLAAVEAGAEEDGQEAEGSGQQAQQHAQQQAQQAEQEDEEEEQAAEAPAAKKQKHEVYHSKGSRKAALLAKAAAQTAKKQGGAKAAAAAKARQAAAPGARLASWLVPALRTLLAEPPTKLPGGCYSRAGQALRALCQPVCRTCCSCAPRHVGGGGAPLHCCCLLSLLSASVSNLHRLGPASAGAAVFTCKDTAALDCLTAEPRAVSAHLLAAIQGCRVGRCEQCR